MVVTEVNRIVSLCLGTHGSDHGLFNFPRGVAMDGEGNILEAWQMIAFRGSHSRGDNSVFSFLYYIDCASAGKVYVS